MDEKQAQQTAENVEEQQDLSAKEKSSKEDKSNDVKIIKTRAVLATEESHPLSRFLMEAKKRGLKSFDPSAVILDALNTLDDQWWDDKLEELTPLEFKISAALTDPKMREKLTMLLSSQKLDGAEATMQ